MSYYDFAKSLQNLSFEKVYSGAGKVFSIMQNPIGATSSLANSAKESILALKEKLEGMTGYEAAKGGSYLSTNIGLGIADPTGKILLASGGFFIKADGIISLLKYSKALSKIKPIKSIDMDHILERHEYGTPANSSKFTQGLDIEATIRNGYINNSKRAIETFSGSKQSIKIEIDMGKNIGISNGKISKILRVIVDYDGNVISSYPIDKFSI